MDFGPANVWTANLLPKPAFVFNSRSSDLVRQLTAGIAYEGNWKDIGQIGVGVQKTHCRKVVDEPGSAPARSRDAPILFYGTVEAKLNARVAVFAGMTRGLEETGIAPDNASNRGQALAAARTRQIDAGLSYSLMKNLQLVAATFDVTKPYFNLNSTNFFTALGSERHRGIEISATGSLATGLSIVAGAVLLDPHATGQAENGGRIGRRPINSSPRLVRISAEYVIPRLNGFSLDFGIDHEQSALRAGTTESGCRTAQFCALVRVIVSSSIG